MLRCLENFAVHVHHSPHMPSYSWWIKLAGVMFCDKRWSLRVSDLLSDIALLQIT